MDETDTTSWDQFPRSNPDKSAEPLFIAVGQALTTWERLEETLAVLYGALVSSRRGGAERAFGTIPGSSARGLMITEAAEVVLKNAPELLDKIKKLIIKIGRGSARRNEIAHGIVTSFDNYGWYLVPALYNSKKNKAFFDLKNTSNLEDFLQEDFWYFKKYSYAYSSSQIQIYSNNFVKLRSIVIDVGIKVQSSFATDDE